MAIGDILEGILAGAAGGFRGYSEFQQAEALRKEREAEREAARREREEERDYQRELDRALRDATMAEAGYRVAPEMAVEGATIAPTAPELARVLEEPEFGVDIPAPRRPETRDGRMDGGAMVAPGQTYSAIQQALMEAERPEAAPPRSRVVMERGEAPEPIRLPSAVERGASVLRFPDDRTYVRERQLTEAEKAEMDLQRDIERAVAVSKAQFEATQQQREKLADELNLTGVERNEFITTGNLSRFAPRTVDREDADPFGAELSLLTRTFMQYNNGMLPTAEQRADLALQAAIATGTPLEEAQRRAAIGAPAPTPSPLPGGDEGGLQEGETADLVGDVLSFTRGESEANAALRERLLSEQVELPRELDEIDRVLSSGVYNGKPLSGFERDVLENRRAMLSSRISREPYRYKRSFRGPGT